MSCSNTRIALPSFALFRKLDIAAALRATGGTGDAWNKCECIEWIDATGSPLSAENEESLDVHYFMSETPAKFDIISTFIWVQLYPDSKPQHVLRPEARDAVPRTGFPYGSPQKLCTEHAEMTPNRIAISSRVDDGLAAASNWQNAVILLKDVVDVKAHELVVVETRVEEGCIYSFKVTVGAKEIVNRRISNLYPDFEEFEKRERVDTTLTEMSHSLAGHVIHDLT